MHAVVKPWTSDGRRSSGGVSSDVSEPALLGRRDSGELGTDVIPPPLGVRCERVGDDGGDTAASRSSPSTALGAIADAVHTDMAVIAWIERTRLTGAREGERGERRREGRQAGLRGSSVVFFEGKRGLLTLGLPHTYPAHPSCVGSSNSLFELLPPKRSHACTCVRA